MYTTQDMINQMAVVGYEPVSEGWWGVDAALLRKKQCIRKQDYFSLGLDRRGLVAVIDKALRIELIEHRVPGQKFILFHLCDAYAFEQKWFYSNKEIISFGVFQAIPHFYHIDDGPNMSIRYTEECSRCKEQLSTNIIGSMKLKYTLE